ncbi:unnamed protein product [Linum tenue]|uniref:glucan endo-1,3-beta-D-glucosidase n=1 Tax=Linum tenue TaxID=586396 RepID=A0AAV0ILN1_9ROSI|nr:unnamed protein product [Linum tenue]
MGINYGQIANNLPSPSRVVGLLQSLNVSRVKLYDADPNVLLAFANTNVEFIIGLGNEYIQSVPDAAKAQAWIETHVKPYIGRTKITCITVGNEVDNSNDTQLLTNLVPAMQSVYKALVNLGLDKQVTVTTAHSLNILLSFHSQTGYPFLINAYPFFAYKGSPDEVSLDYALFGSNNTGMTDPITNLYYDNMLYAQVDAVYSAIKAMGHTNIEVKVSETGWPSKGDADEVGATPQNAGLYNGNLFKRVQARQGTPAKPSVPIDVHVFALFNEDLKPGPTSERNYGLFYPDGSPVYNMGFHAYLPEGTDIAYTSASGSDVSHPCSFDTFLVEFLKNVQVMLIALHCLFAGFSSFQSDSIFGGLFNVFMRALFCTQRRGRGQKTLEDQ